MINGSAGASVRHDARMQLLGGLLIILGLAAIAAYGLWRVSESGPSFQLGRGLLLAVPIFLMSQVLRSVRLFFLCYDRRIRFGTVIAVHFLSAPVTALVPWKLGEIYRILLLGSYLQDGTRALVAIWTERVHDIVMVAFLLIVLALTSHAGIGQHAPFLLLASGFLFLSFFVFAVLPENLGRLKRYLFLRWHHPQSLRLIAVVDRLHDLFTRAGAMWRSHWATVAWLTVAIWALEIAWITALLTGDMGLDTALAGEALRAFEVLTMEILAWNVEPAGLSVRTAELMRTVLVDLAAILAIPAACLLARSGLRSLRKLRRSPG